MKRQSDGFIDVFVNNNTKFGNGLSHMLSYCVLVEVRIPSKEKLNIK